MAATPGKIRCRGKLVPMVSLAILMTVAGAGGYYLRALRENPVTRLAPGEIPALEYFVSGRSFSEVEEAKNVLQAAAARLIDEMRDRSGVGLSIQIAEGGDPVQPEGRRLAERELAQNIVEFEGTGHELELTKEYLWMLSRGGQVERFLEVYLRALYPHPTAEFVGLFAEKALHLGQTVGREPEVLEALQYAQSIPFEFEGKTRILSAIDRARWVVQTSPGEPQQDWPRKGS